MFYGIYPPWAGCLIALAAVALVGFIICGWIALYRTYNYNRTWRFYPAAGALALIGAASIVFASIQAYNSQVALYNLSVKQHLVHIDSANGLSGTLHAYNTTGNCYVYATYDSYQKAMVIDGYYLPKSSFSLNGMSVYRLTTKPLTQDGIDKLCSANYGEDAFNNSKDDK